MIKTSLTFILLFLALNTSFSQENKETKKSFEKYRQIENKEDFLQVLDLIEPNNIKVYDYQNGYFLKAFKIEKETVKLITGINKGEKLRTFTKAYYYLLLGKKGDTTYTKTRLYRTDTFLNPKLYVDVKKDSEYHEIGFYAFRKKDEKIPFDGLQRVAYWSIIKEPYSLN